jgi:hypothetical protein
VVNNRYGRDAERALLHVSVIVTHLGIVNVTKFDFKHGNDRPEEVLHENFLLVDQ